VIVIGGLINFRWLSAEQPDPSPQALPKPIVPQELSEAAPANLAPAVDPNESLKDPLYQAIRDQLNNGRPSLMPVENQKIVQSHIDGDDSITPAEWEAVELILRAARILERDEKLKGRINQAANQKSTAKQLRAQALQILRVAMEP